jgi:hypothetical protein
MVAEESLRLRVASRSSPLSRDKGERSDAWAIRNACSRRFFPFRAAMGTPKDATAFSGR